MWADLSIGGTLLSSFVGIVSFDGIFADAPLRGDNVTYPGVAGATHTAKVRDAYVFTVPLVLLGVSQADFQTRLDALRTLCDSSAAPLNLVRRRTTGGGNIEESALGDYVGGLEPAMVNMQTGRLVLNLMNLSGGWTLVP